MLAASLVALAVGAAGCGGTTPISAALHDARDAGGAQPHAVRAERWRISNGDPVDVVLVRARFCGTGNGFTARNSSRAYEPRWLSLSGRRITIRDVLNPSGTLASAALAR